MKARTKDVGVVVKNGRKRCGVEIASSDSLCRPGFRSRIVNVDGGWVG